MIGDEELWSLLAAWQVGDDDAGDRLVTLTVARVARFFRNKVSSPPDDKDLVQKTFLALAGTRPRSTEGSFWSLVYGIARNVLAAHVRERYKRAREDADFVAVCVHDLDPSSMSSIIVRRRELGAFVEGLRRIPLRDQTLLELRYFEGLNAREIADVMEMPRGSVHAAIEAGIARLRAQVRLLLQTERSGEAPELPSEHALEGWANEVRARLL